MRWTQRSVRRALAVADGEAVWFWRPEAGVKFATTPTRRADDGVNKAVVPGKSAEETVKPLRGECRMFSGASAVNTGVHTHYQYAHTRLRVHWAPGIPRALCFKGREFLAKLGRIRGPRMRRCVFLPLEPNSRS